MKPTTTLADRLGAALLPPGATRGGDTPTTADRILDAAAQRYVEVGIQATTMSSIASAAGVSREWLYRNFSNKQSVLQAVVERELRRFIEGLANSVDWSGDVAELLTEAFVYCVEFFRDRPAIQGLVDHGALGGVGNFRTRAVEIVGLAVRSCADYLVDLGGYEPARAQIVAEALVRLVGSTLVAPQGLVDLHDDATLRRFAHSVVPAIATCEVDT
jgi:AcrR family transcriptional regulator